MQEPIPYILIRGNIKNLYIHIQDGKVIVKAPYKFSVEQIEKIVEEKQKWIEKNLRKSIQKKDKEERYTKEEFVRIIEENTKELIKFTNLRPNRVRVKQIKYAWGSCSSRKNITINQKLICYSEQAIRYVILHELCHLRYMNHGKEFWNLVAMYMPDYKEVKKELNK